LSKFSDMEVMERREGTRGSQPLGRKEQECAYSCDDYR